MPNAAKNSSVHDVCVLRCATPRAWAVHAIASLPSLLVEQAHLEKKAAAAASRFLFSLPQTTSLLRALSHLAREELVHFERSLRLLDQRGIPFVRLEPSRYADQLKVACASTMPERQIDELLVASLIEARSHERMERLGEALVGVDDEASEFYLDLVEAEARHRCVYLDIACELAGESVARERFRPLSLIESRLVEAADDVVRLHGGHGRHVDA